MSVSVCMATYNGEKFVVRQLRSILEQLSPEDEVIVVDDASTDETVAAITALKDPRVKVYVNERNRREVFSFGRAIELAKNDVVFLSDQDDVWVPRRVERMSQALRESGAGVVTTNFEWMDDAEQWIDIPFDGVRSADSRKHFRNVLDIFVGKTNYFGCAMAMTQGFSRVVTPIPSFVESHDLWIALGSNLFRSNVHLDDNSLRKRRHGNNATSTVSTRPLPAKLWSRVVFGMSLVVLAMRFSKRPR